MRIERTLYSYCAARELCDSMRDAQGRDNDREGERPHNAARAVVRARARLQRDGRASALRAVSRGRAAEAQGGGAHGLAARDRRDQLALAGLPRALLWCALLSALLELLFSPLFSSPLFSSTH